MNPPYESGQKCRVVGGRMAYNDEGKGPNIGKEVTTMFLHTKQAGMEMENVWHCQGENLISYHGGVGNEADFLECWLELLPTEESNKSAEEQKYVEI